MSKHGRFDIRKWRDPASGMEGITFWCHGCKSAHSVNTSPGGWLFNGDWDNPVIHPSIRTYIPERKDKVTGVVTPQRTMCHSFVGSNGALPGQIIFLDDSSEHNLRGVHNLEKWPDYFCFIGGGETG